MVLCSSRDASVSQAVTQNPRPSFSFLCLNTPPPVLEDLRNGCERSRSEMTNPTNGSKRGKSVENIGLMSQAPLLCPRNLILEDENIPAGTSRLPPFSSDGQKNRHRSRKLPKDM